MTTHDFYELGLTWKKLNEIYDNKIIAILEDATILPLSDETLRELTSLQKELFELETRILEVAQISPLSF